MAQKARFLTFAPETIWYQTDVPPKSMWKSYRQAERTRRIMF